jgi:hypothetical protein
MEFLPNISQPVQNENDFVLRSEHINNVYEMYSWHFRIHERPAEFSELIQFASWLGLKIKQPTKEQLVNFFLEQNIAL